MKTEEMCRSVPSYRFHLEGQELANATRKKYVRDAVSFLRHVEGLESVGKKDVIAYKEHLRAKYKTATVNSYIISLNRFFAWLGCEGLAVKTLRLQRRSGMENVLSHSEYRRILEYCLKKKGNATISFSGPWPAREYESASCRT